MSQPKRVKTSKPTLDDLASQLDIEGEKLCHLSSAHDQQDEYELNSLASSLSRACDNIGMIKRSDQGIRSCQYHYDTSGKLQRSKRGACSGHSKPRQRVSVDHAPTGTAATVEGIDNTHQR